MKTLLTLLTLELTALLLYPYCRVLIQPELNRVVVGLGRGTELAAILDHADVYIVTEAETDVLNCLELTEGTDEDICNCYQANNLPCPINY